MRLESECDLRCVLCARAPGHGTDALQRVEDASLAGVTLRIAGCDPVRRKDLTTLAHTAKARGAARVTVETPGPRLSTSAIEALARAGVDEIALPLYSSDPTVHDAVTGRSGAHARHLAVLDTLGDGALDVSFDVTVLSATAQDLGALVAEALSRVPRTLEVRFALPLHAGAAGDARVARLLPERLAPLRPRLARALDVCAARGVSARLAPRGGLPFCALGPEHAHGRHAPWDPSRPVARDADDRLGKGCDRCAMHDHCRGVPAWFADLHGTDDLTPFDAPLPRDVPVDPDAQLAPRRLIPTPAPSSRLRVLLVNQCEATWGYGPGASEYLRAHLLAHTDLREHIDVDILFAVGTSPERVATEILARDPDLIGFSTYSWNLGANLETTRAVRRAGSDAVIVWGGVSFSYIDRDPEWFPAWRDVDAVARGSGEATLEAVVRQLLGGPDRRRLQRLVPGLVRRRDHGFEVAPPAAPPDFDALASPYLAGTVFEVARPTIEMARGCIFECAFCSDAKSSREGRMVLRAADRLAEEIRVITTWPSAEWIDAGASTANATSEAFRSVCDAIRRGDPERRLRYGFQMYPALARPEQRDALNGIRVGALHFGVQSLTPATFATMRRGTRTEHVERARRVFDGVGPIELSLILGLPGETYESFRASYEELLAVRGVHLVVNRLLVLPGTAYHLHRHALGLGFDPHRYFRVTHTPTMSADDLRRAQDTVIERALSLPDLLQGGEPRVRWVNFDVQQSFAAPPEYGTGLAARRSSLEPEVRQR